MSSNQNGNSSPTKTSKLEQMLKQVTVSMSALSVNTILHCYLHPTTIEDLPDDLLINISIRLLAKQLAQMRTVSKSWNALLSHPSFIKSHLHHSIHNNHQQILLVFSKDSKPFTKFFSQSPHLEPTNFIKLPPTNLPMRVIGAVNGLICLSSEDSYSNIHIWNPSLSAISPIPRSYSTPPTSQYILNYMRFGYDPKTDDYKLVKMSGICDNNRDFFSEVKEWLGVEVYSLRKGSWKFITQPFPSHITRIYSLNYFCVDGRHGYLHWLTTTITRTDRKILAFDLGSETFREIPLPDSVQDSNHKWHRLGVLEGKVCEMSWSKDGGWEVWVMEEYGLPESWAKRHVFPQFNDEVRLYGFTSCNELFVLSEEDEAILCDPITNTTKSTPAKLVTTIVEHVDSLVWMRALEVMLTRCSYKCVINCT